ncbi:MAG TPA: PEP-CTERM sorting domain-containing protein [Casimicrobiaceae bacterium]|jgi:hypothetical protein
MHTIGKLFGFGLALLFALIQAQPALATTVPLVVGTASDDVIVNFDFSSEATPPPYSNTILAFFQLDVSAAPADVVFDFYDGLNGASFLGSDTTTLPTVASWSAGAGCPSATAFCAGVLDGTFSIGLHLTAGAADFSDLPSAPIALAFNFGSEDIIAGVDGTLGTRALPEPVTLALLGIGLAAIAAGRRRKMH